MPAVPIPSNILNAAGEYQAVLKVLERDLRDVERRIERAARAGKGISNDLLSRKEELLGDIYKNRTGLIESQTEEAFQKRADRWSEKKARAAMAGRSSGGLENLRNARDLFDLTRGQVSMRNIAGSVELLTDIRKGGLAGVKDMVKSVPQGIASMTGLGGLGAAGLPLAFAALAADLFTGAHKTGQEHGRREGALDKSLSSVFIGTSEARRDFRDRLKETADPGRVGGSFAERLEASSARRAKLQTQFTLATQNAGLASTTLRRAYGIHVAGTPEDVTAALNQLAAEGHLERAQRWIEGDITFRGEQQNRTALYYSRNPDAAARMHAAERVSSRLESDRISRGVKGWN